MCTSHSPAVYEEIQEETLINHNFFVTNDVLGIIQELKHFKCSRLFRKGVFYILHNSLQQKASFGRAPAAPNLPCLNAIVFN